MKPLAVIFLLTFSPFLLSAQSKNYRQDSTTAISLLRKGDAMFNVSKFDSAIFYYTKMEMFSREKNFRMGIYEAIAAIGEAYRRKEDYDQAEKYFLQMQQDAQQVKDSFYLVYSWLSLGRLQMYRGKLDEAIDLYIRCIQKYYEKHPSEEGAGAYGDLAYAYGLKGQYINQADALIKSIHVIEDHFPGSRRFLGVKYNNLGLALFKQNEKTKAIEYFKKGAALRTEFKDLSGLTASYANLTQAYLGIDNKESERYLELCGKVAAETNENRTLILYNTIASDFYNATGVHQKAMEFELEAIRRLEQSGKDQSRLGARYVSAAMLADKLGKDSADIIQYYNKAAAIIAGQPVNQLANQREYHYNLYRFYQGRGDHAASLNAYQQYIRFRDRLAGEKTRSEIAEITTKYETEKKDLEISRLNTAQRIHQLEIEKQKAIIHGNTAEAKRKQNEIDLLAQTQILQDLKLKQQGEELEKQSLLAKNNEQQLLLAKQQEELNLKALQAQKQLRNLMIAGAVLLLLLAIVLFNRYQLKKKLEQQGMLLAVRNDIAKDLHDEIGSTLTSIKILSEVSKESLLSDKVKAGQLMEKITEQSAAMQQGMSDIVWAIKPDHDKLEDMLVRMREYVTHTLEPKNISTTFDVQKEVLAAPLSMQQRKDFFLVFKEAINNIAKYSGADRVSIVLHCRNKQILMQIMDNGKGFDPHMITSSSGLKNMKQRAGSLNGTLNIESTPGNGATVTLEMPTT